MNAAHAWEAVRDPAILHERYGKPVEAAIQKVSPRITPAYRRLIEASPFFMLASAGPEGLDCSPRGDRTDAFRLLDDRTIVIPDWKGNNRIDTLSNIVRDPRIAMLFLIPGSTTTVRLNGTAFVTLDAELLASFERDGKHPRSAIVICLGEIYTQCGKAVVRADLWNPQNHGDPAALPSVGEILAEVTQGKVSAQEYEIGRKARLADGIW
jgi:uncharacterized protein